MVVSLLGVSDRAMWWKATVFTLQLSTRHDMRKLTRDEFISRAESSRSDLSYSMVNYRGLREKVIVKALCCGKRQEMNARKVLLGQKVWCGCIKNRRGFSHRIRGY